MNEEARFWEARYHEQLLLNKQDRYWHKLKGADIKKLWLKAESPTEFAYSIEALLKGRNT